MSEKISCECGGEFLKKNKSCHNKSQRHKDWLEGKPKPVLTESEERALRHNRENQRRYYEKHKHELERLVECEDCGKEYKKNRKSKHIKTIYHQEALRLQLYSDDEIP